MWRFVCAKPLQCFLDKNDACNIFVVKICGPKLANNFIDHFWCSTVSGLNIL